MKRFTALFLLLCMALAAMPVMAESDYIGNMEVVNCKEWVSLREEPSTRSPRLTKVSLGAIVSSCRRVDDEWVHCQYDGHAGYILAEYLDPSDGRTTFSAMMITITGEGAPFYATLNSPEPADHIPANTIVRNCRIMNNDRVYVEWGDRCGFIPLLHAEVYSEMLHFPQQITLHCSLFDSLEEGAPSALRVNYAQDFPLADDAYSEYVQEDQGLPMASFVLHTDKTLRTVHLFGVSLRTMDDDSGTAVLALTLEHIQHQLEPEHPLAVTASLDGAIPNLAVGYESEPGVYRFAFIEISGEDGSLLLREF